MLKVFVTGKVLPIGILQETANHRLVALAEGMLQLLQPNDQAGRQSRTIDVLHEQLTELGVEKLPLDLIGKLKESALPVENLVQAGAEPLALGTPVRRVSGAYEITGFCSISNNSWRLSYRIKIK